MDKLLRAFVAILLSSVAYYYSFGFYHIWFLMWLAPIPLLIYTFGTNSFFRATIVSLIVGTTVMWFNNKAMFQVGIIGLPITILIGTFVVQPIEWTIVLLISRYFVRKMQHPISIFFYPILLSLLEFTQSITEQGTFNSFAYSQLSVLPIIQIASITGFIGITFLLALFASAIACALIINTKSAYKFTLVAFSIIIISIGYGYWRINHLQVQHSIPVGAVVMNNKLQKTMVPQMAESIVNEYTPLITHLAQNGAQIVLLPEMTITLDQTNLTNIEAQLSNLAKANSLMLIMGVNDKSGGLHYNSTLVFDQQGQLVGSYSKHHFIPKLEDGIEPGKSLLFVHTLNNFLVGVAICRDMDYMDPANSYGYAGTNILFVPALDFIVDAKVHWEGAIMRGVENGYTVVRSARNGMLSVTSPTGEMIGQVDATADPTTLLANAPLMPNSSFYAQHPYWFVLLLIILLIILILFSFLIRFYHE